MTHLQFADDTVLFCRADMKEVHFLKMILHVFEGCSGLKINFGKSMCYGIGLKEEEVLSFAEVIGCPAGSFPMSYLGMQVGANPAKKQAWEPMLRRFKQKLGSWRSANLSMAGLPLYYASIYKMPIGVAHELEKIQKQFLWGGSESRKKVHHVKWASVLKPKQYGGLGIVGMVEKNMALLTKWWWRLVSGQGGLWRRMISEKYAIKGAHDPLKMTAKVSRVSRTWKNIISAVRGNSEVATAFREGLKLKLGRGNEISFWDDVWLGVKSFKDQYPKLYTLALDNQLKVGEMGYWLDGVWHWQVRFRRPLYQWEDALKNELLEGLNHVHPRDRDNDSIVWAYSQDGRYSTNTLMKAVISLKANKRNWEHLPFQLWSGLAPPKHSSYKTVCR
ncbi:hypothetical protein QQ045_011229 [Rhodiola kirilowii]